MTVKSYEKMSLDADLFELAGYQAYLKHDKKDYIIVNESTYRVINTNDNTSNGLDALTVQNLDNKEITVVYVGTDKDQPEDILTDAQLLSDMAVPQLEDAKDYF
nr:hypothetical protein [Paraliobacillus ryukyuensis]